ncbi:hypothetical protein, partial [Hahella ganghwensis]|uniref:hypothetical protein n=1 Tax=Hahella ganghwensis TaxID=286420 RepID=UPI001B7F94ED
MVEPLIQQLRKLCSAVIMSFLLGALVACGGSGGGSDNNDAVAGSESITIDVVVRDLVGRDLIIQSSGGDTITIPENGTHSFETSVDDDGGAVLSVASQPSEPEQLCVVLDRSSTSTEAEVDCSLLVGYFSDSPVEGLTYTTTSQSGYTDQEGRFLYQAGEEISFFVGDMQIGDSVAAKAHMTPVDIVTGAKLYTRASDIERIYNGDLSKQDETSFNRLHNILTFLQSIDEDSSSDNGIRITAEVSALFNGVSIDFEEDYDDFEDDDNLRRILNGAANAGLLQYGGILKTMQALDHFYNAQGISYSFPIPGYSDVDSDGDGSVDYNQSYDFDSSGGMVADDLTYASGTFYYYRYTYDRWGNRLSENYMESGSVGDPTKVYTYDNSGNLLSGIEDLDRDGAPNRIYFYTYDDQGNRLSYTDDSNGDGTAD